MHIRDDFDSGFGSRLRTAIERAGITQLELAHRTGLNKDSISNYVKGRIPRANILYRIVRELVPQREAGAAMVWLLTGKGWEPQLRDPLFAQRLSQALRENNLTIRDLAHDVQLSTRDVARILEGHVPDAFTLLRIADRTGVSMRWLLIGAKRPYREADLTFEDGLRFAQQAITQAITQAFEGILTQSQSSSDPEFVDAPDLESLIRQLTKEEQFALIRYMEELLENRRRSPGKEKKDP